MPSRPSRWTLKNQISSNRRPLMFNFHCQAAQWSVSLSLVKEWGALAGDGDVLCCYPTQTGPPHCPAKQKKWKERKTTVCLASLEETWLAEKTADKKSWTHRCVLSYEEDIWKKVLKLQKQFLYLLNSVGDAACKLSCTLKDRISIITKDANCKLHFCSIYQI